MTVATATLAGCGDNGEDEPVDDPDDEPADDPDDDAPVDDEEDEPDDDEPADDEEDDELDDDEDDEEDEDEPDDDEDDEDDENGAADLEEWEDVDEIVLDGYTPGWEGVEPSVIEGEENPTLVLFEGQEYDITWENMDGEPHNIEIWDDDGEIVDDYETETIEEEGETQTLTIEASEEMAEYVCVVHPGTMIGDVQIETNGDE
ncbi:plastocyanin/azurin family copper-binding protein [Natrononativus amylolyticus]|uniref:plastocyanin/azurin family copper-binding protein n=1 Tax=Natrononativus amylolyticus TaxID=2963434 RepID=UPI0020CC4D07|nr:plastocyanin/azurin family copper-binding protein [Natrononativus amylolyticus]